MRCRPHKVMFHRSGVTLGIGAPCWRSCRPKRAILLNVSLKIKFRLNNGNSGKNITKIYISSPKRVILLVLQLGFPKKMSHIFEQFCAPINPPLQCGVSRAYHYAIVAPVINRELMAALHSCDVTQTSLHGQHC